ncbi:thrombospondin [Archangium violaceum]|uniref:adventurous gliding motility lipoprotein CglD n=1 Tax=Archangium violaceum TaxID=83451 RepID=UPI00193C857C|nr:adventurous gliding motility lipoprotein CglD [Archangium violaceum]QRK08863.1 thrombospondin [Archangium violaceum]
MFSVYTSSRGPLRLGLPLLVALLTTVVGCPGPKPECVYNSDCEGSNVCRSGTCVAECKSNVDCEEGYICSDQRCVRQDTGDAGLDAGLDAGVQGCVYNSDCTEPHLCLQGVCRAECIQTVDCAEGYVCQEFRCVRNNPRDAGTNEPEPDGGSEVPDGGSEVPDGGSEVPDGGSEVPDGGTTPLPPDPSDPNNATKDTDCDGLSDKVEFETDRGNGKHTDPGLADTDGDGLQDGLELGIDQPVPGTNCTLPKDADTASNTNPVNADTDGDGLWDGVEDANKNGRVDDTETHPLRKDTDCDGLVDGPSTGSVKGEDQNANGIREASETDPRQADTDGDGIVDGVERGVTTHPDAANCTGFLPDMDPGTTTDATQPDTDGDGVSDGVEDDNQNGRVDPGELDPNNGGDATGPVGQVCTADNLRPVTFQSESGPDIKLALPPTFTEVTQIKSGAEVKGLVGYDSTSKTAFLAFRTTPPVGATDPLGDEEALRPAIASKGALRNRTAQAFKTWEGFDAVQAFYDQDGTTTDLKRRTDQLVDALVPGSTGRLSGTAAGVMGDFRLQTLFVHRSSQSLVVLIAVAPLASVTGSNRGTPAAFSVKDLSDGSALAQFGEPTAVRCERFTPPESKVDFIFVVDDSGSMMSSQLSLAATAQSAANALNAASLDWRMALVTTSYHLGPTGLSSNAGKVRHFTRNVNKVKAWLTENSVCNAGTCSVVPTTPMPADCPGDTSQGVNGGCWVGMTGSGNEGLLGAARKVIDDMTPGTDPGGVETGLKVRKDAALVVILLGDADDQTSGYTTTIANCGSGGTKDVAGISCENVANFMRFFGDRSELPPTNKTGKPITVHGIVCPSGQACGCATGICDLSNSTREFNPQPVGGVSKLRHAAVVNASGGVLGSILDTASIEASMEAIIADAIGNSGYKTLEPPIGASIKVAMDNVLNPAVCSASNDIPRSTVNGFDFDGNSRTLSFFGACRPATESTQVAVSYQYWVDSVKAPNGVIPCENDPNYSPIDPDHCEGPRLECGASGTWCVCKPDCGGTCGTGTRCDMTLCACVP